LLQSALKGAELLTREGGETISGEPLAEIAKQMVLTEAVIRRISMLYDESVLRALQDLGEISLADKQGAEDAAAKLRPILGAIGSEVIVGFDAETESYRLEINKYVHGNLQCCVIDHE